MKAMSRVALVLFVSIACLATERVWAEVKLPGASATPADLVKAALQCEVDGASTLRAALLSDALSRDPNFAPARWHSGFVRFDGDWIKVDDVPERTADDKRLNAYRKLRDAMVDTADEHRGLARWCHKNQLLDEERIHWAKVLEFERGDAESLAALGLKLHEGRWLSRAQIEAEKLRAGERLKAARTWQPRVVKWRAAIDRGNGKERDKALAALRELNDPAAIPVLELAFAVNADSPKAAELNRVLIETVGRMPHPDATQVLLRRAILPDSPEVRAAAADELKKRPMYAYAPQLIAAMPGSLKTRFHVSVLPSGMVVHEHEFYLEGQKADFAINCESIVSPADAVAAFVVTPRALSTELARAEAVEAQVSAVQGQADWMRDRVQSVLQRTTGFTTGDDPRLWEKQYNDYYGSSTSNEEKPVYQQNYWEYAYYFTPPAERSTTSSPTSGTSSPSTPPASLPSNVTTPAAFPMVRSYQTLECFPAGTKILSIQGSRPIEELKMGDLVLSQDVRTGELAYKPIQSTTLRATTPLMKVTLAGHTVSTTPGHPFWVNGLGWQPAKKLSPGMRLHGLDSSEAVDAVEPLRSAEAYNLIVSEFHNYFLASPRLLVHDNSPIEDVPVVTPGLEATVQ